MTVFRPRSPLLYSIGGLISVGVGWLVGGSVYKRSQGFRLIETAGLPMGCPYPQLLPDFPLFNNRCQLLLSIDRLGEISASDTF